MNQSKIDFLKNKLNELGEDNRECYIDILDYDNSDLNASDMELKEIVANIRVALSQMGAMVKTKHLKSDKRLSITANSFVLGKCYRNNRFLSKEHSEIATEINKLKSLILKSKERLAILNKFLISDPRIDEKIKRVVSYATAPVTLRIIKNKMRPADKETIELCVQELVNNGKLIKKAVVIKGQKTNYYFIDN